MLAAWLVQCKVAFKSMSMCYLQSRKIAIQQLRQQQLRYSYGQKWFMSQSDIIKMHKHTDGEMTCSRVQLFLLGFKGNQTWQRFFFFFFLIQTSWYWWSSATVAASQYGISTHQRRHMQHAWRLFVISVRSAELLLRGTFRPLLYKTYCPALQHINYRQGCKNK